MVYTTNGLNIHLSALDIISRSLAREFACACRNLFFFFLISAFSLLLLFLLLFDDRLNEGTMIVETRESVCVRASIVC